MVEVLVIDVRDIGGVVEWAHGSAMLQCLLPGLVLLHKDQVVVEADKWKLGGAVFSRYQFGFNSNGDTVASGA